MARAGSSGSGAGVRDEADEPNPVDRLFVTVLRLAQRRLLEDSTAAVDAIRSSDPSWTIVRAPRFVDEPGGGETYVGPVGRDSGTKVALADVATLMLSEAVSAARMHEAPVISAR